MQCYKYYTNKSQTSAFVVRLCTILFTRVTSLSRLSTDMTSARKPGQHPPVSGAFRNRLRCLIDQQDCSRLLGVTQQASTGRDERLEAAFDSTWPQVETHGFTIRVHEENWGDDGLNDHVLLSGRHARNVAWWESKQNRAHRMKGAENHPCAHIVTNRVGWNKSAS